MPPAIPHPSSSMDVLPDEVILEILDKFAVIRGVWLQIEEEDARRARNRESLDTLYSLTLTCRRLNHMVTPFLYRSLVVPADDPGTLRIFAQTLLDRPSLRHFVRYVEAQVPPSGPLCSTEAVESDRFTDSLFHDVIRAVNRKELSDLVHQSLPNIKWKHCLTAVVLLANNVTHLQVYSHESCNKGVCQCATDQSPGWTHDSNFIFDHPWLHNSLQRYTTISEAWIKELFNEIHPGIVETYTSLPGPRDDSWALHRNTALEQIMFRFCNYGPNDFTKIYFPNIDKNCHINLKKFVCKWEDFELDFVERDNVVVPINLKELCRDMSRFQSTLETLSLDTELSGGSGNMDRPKLLPIGSLRNFVALKHLNVSGNVLWGDCPQKERLPLVSILPDRLRNLVIHVKWDDYVEESLTALSKVCRLTLPVLSSIKIRVYPGSKSIKDAESLISRFATENVTLILKK